MFWNSEARRSSFTGGEIVLVILLCIAGAGMWEAHRHGLRFRKNHLIHVGDVRVTPDIVFTGPRIVVFVDGCFWHSCPEHGNRPTAPEGGGGRRTGRARAGQVSTAEPAGEGRLHGHDLLAATPTADKGRHHTRRPGKAEGQSRGPLP